jgi:hypothetical protein
MSKHSSQHPVLKHPQSVFFPQHETPSFTSCKTRGKIIIILLYILIFKCLDVIVYCFLSKTVYPFKMSGSQNISGADKQYLVEPTLVKLNNAKYGTLLIRTDDSLLSYSIFLY